MLVNKIIRRQIRKLIRRIGFQRRIAPDFFDVMTACNIDVVLDIGANDGDYGREIRDSGYKGLIVSFEPNPVVYSRLQKTISRDDNWIAYPFAIGDKDNISKMMLAINDTMSSLKSLTNFGMTTGARPTGSIDVEVVRLDTFLQNHQELLLKNIYLKIDTQGYEMEVLSGSGSFLEKIAVIQAEIALVQTYADEMDWVSVITWLRERKFEVATAICNSALGAQVREFDFVFVRNGINKNFFMQNSCAPMENGNQG